jgi:hypothetical protein
LAIGYVEIFNCQIGLFPIKYLGVGDNNLAIGYTKIFNCQIGLFPIKYLWVLVSPSRLRVANWNKLEEKH